MAWNSTVNPRFPSGLTRFCTRRLDSQGGRIRTISRAHLTSRMYDFLTIQAPDIAWRAVPDSPSSATFESTTPGAYAQGVAADEWRQSANCFAAERWLCGRLTSVPWVSGPI